MEINNNTRKSSASEIQNIPNHALFHRIRVGNAFFGSGARAVGAAEEEEADLEMKQERYEDWRFQFMGGVGPGTDEVRTDRSGTVGTSGNCAIGDSDIGEPSAEELGECKGIDAEERASGERDGGERDGTEVGRHGIKVWVLRSAGTAKFKHDPA